jgi:hypothetical protein
VPEAQTLTPALATARLYRGITGFTDPVASPTGRKLRPGKALVYGEITAAGTRRVVAATGLGDGDVFVDLGSGIGKVALQVALTVPGVRCIGVEIDSLRHEKACKALQRALARGLLAAGQCVFQHRDIRDTDLSEATVVLANSTCFPPPLVRLIARHVAGQAHPVTLVATEALHPRTAAPLRHLASIHCPTSWNAAHQVHLYRRPT